MPATSPASLSPSLAAPSQAELAPQQLWRLFAPVIAGRMRIRTLNGRSRYRAAGRLQPEVLPAEPAAVLLFDASARCRCFVLDLDSKSSTRHQVLLDSERVVAMAASAGLPAVVDESPNGGRHVYLPLAHPISATDALEVGQALRGLLPSLDTAPLSNPTTGAIRPPGSAHPSGGHQRLVTELDASIGAFYVPGGPAQWKRFVASLPRQAATVRTSRPLGQPPAPADSEAQARPALEPWASIARTGTYDQTVYATPSEARFAAICHLLRRGWTAQDITAAAVDGRYPGLLRLLTKQHRRLHALTSDVRRASHKLTTCYDRELLPNVPHKGPPTPPQPAPDKTSLPTPGTYGFLRSWWTAARHEGRLRTGTTALVDRSVLQALGAMAQMRGTRHLDVGCRALSQAACLDHSTVARSLKRLAEEPDPFIVLLQASADTDGAMGDLYELVIPSRHAAKALTDPWAPGKIERVHPVFWMLTKASRYAWAALTEQPRPEADVRRDAGLARQTCREAIAELAAHGLARHVPGEGWERGHASLNQVARRVGGDAKALEVQQRHLKERRVWRVLKRLPAPAPDRARSSAHSHTADNGWWADGTPIPVEPVRDGYSPGDMETALALVRDILGAEPVLTAAG